MDHGMSGRNREMTYGNNGTGSSSVIEGAFVRSEVHHGRARFVANKLEGRGVGSW